MGAEPRSPQPAAGPCASGWCLEITSPGGVVSHLPIGGPRIIIGRASDCGVKLEHEMVSRHHAELFSDPFGRWWIHDLGSRNGIRVNGLRVSERVVALGDVLEIGPFALRLYQPHADEKAGSAPAKPMDVSETNIGKVTTLTALAAPKVSTSHLMTLVDFGRRLLTTDGAEGRLRALCGLMTGTEFGGRAAVVMRLRKDRPGEPPEQLCEPAVAPGWERDPLRTSRGLLRAVIERNQPILASNAAYGPVDVQLTLSRDVLAMSALACPLHSDERTMDVLYVVLPPEFGTGEWLALATLAATEFEKAEFAWASRRQAEEHAAIARELEQAREIQGRLIPRQISVAGLDLAIGFEPCRWVGGDYVDVVPTRDGRVLLTIGDVCGKGLQAALVAASLHSLVHANVAAGVKLADLMCGLNHHLREYLPADSFVTMVGAVLDPRTGEMETVNAGHPPAMVVSARGDLRWLHEAGSPPLGIAAPPFECQRERIETGEMLAMFTDGLIESPGHLNQVVGLDDLARQLREACASEGPAPASEIARKLTAALGANLGGSLASDDRTFLLARRL